MTMSQPLRVLLLPVLVAAVMLTGRPPRAAETAASCQGALQPKQVAELLFGRNIGGILGVSEKAWNGFVAGELTPRFPDGLTISDAIGQWRDRASGAMVREPAKRVEIVLPGNADDATRLAAAVKAYEREFRQHSVGIIVRTACVSF
jgi:hypothetical protein